ncbi:MAG: hypothetical protein HY811_07300 [Planctomycetes bacterium]|nr:hypothetical protein [Planctomycetota bacterium]
MRNYQSEVNNQEVRGVLNLRDTMKLHGFTPVAFWCVGKQETDNPVAEVRVSFLGLSGEKG